MMNSWLVCLQGSGCESLNGWNPGREEPGVSKEGHHRTDASYRDWRTPSLGKRQLNFPVRASYIMQRQCQVSSLAGAGPAGGARQCQAPLAALQRVLKYRFHSAVPAVL